MFIFLLIIHIFVCIALVAVVLLQVGRGQGMLGFLGGGGADSLFGSRTGDMLTRSTTVVAVTFMLTSLTLAYISLNKSGSVTKRIKRASGGMEEAALGLAGSQNELIQRSAEVVDRAKNALLDKIPRLGGAPEREVPVSRSMKAVETTKSKIRYDKGNKIEEQFKYDSEGKLTGHKEITYDRLDKIIDEKALPLDDEGVPSASEI